MGVETICFICAGVFVIVMAIVRVVNEIWRHQIIKKHRAIYS